MTNEEPTFEINDALSTLDNLGSFAAVLVSLDAELGAALAPFLGGTAAGGTLDKAAIWNALYASTEPPAQGAFIGSEDAS